MARRNRHLMGQLGAASESRACKATVIPHKRRQALSAIMCGLGLRYSLQVVRVDVRKRPQCEIPPGCRERRRDQDPLRFRSDTDRARCWQRIRSIHYLARRQNDLEGEEL